MSDPLSALIDDTAKRQPDQVALVHGDREIRYRDLNERIVQVARGLRGLEVKDNDRVAIFMDKRPTFVEAVFGVAMAGAIFVPINPVLRARQIVHILRDSGARVLVSTSDRIPMITAALGLECPALDVIVLEAGALPLPNDIAGIPVIGFDALPSAASLPGRRLDTDLAALLYTSGSTGRPKGVVLSHRNLVLGAASVASYLGNTPEDRILAILPFSFDAGLSQLTTGFYSGARVVLHDFVSAQDAVRTIVQNQVTGITAVPPLWHQLVSADWPEGATESVRYIANTGGHMPRPLLDRLQELFGNSSIFLMYGLTEAFRSTFLPPAELSRRPNSIGKAIPNADISVLRADGSEAEPGEEGELVHRGPLVAQGYWNDPASTAARFRPDPYRPAGAPLTCYAVWSGDIVTKDEEGYLYFVSRRDSLIKVSGNRVSPNEVEEVALASGLVDEAVALGPRHPTLGQGILLLVSGRFGEPVPETKESLHRFLRRELPSYMVPRAIEHLNELPRNPNGKIDRAALEEDYRDYFDADNA